MSTPVEQPLVSISIITRDRVEEIEAVLQSIDEQTYSNVEILIGDNGSRLENLQLVRDCAAKRPKSRLLEFGSNLGVAGGRSALLRDCKGQYIVEIDDDALLGNPEVLAKVVHRMATEPDLGIVAFRSINFFSNATDRHEYPFLSKRRDPALPGDTTWFIGCGHCFSRALLTRIGEYREFFPYGQEELDYAFRALDAGFRIFYDPEFVVLHKKSPTHRIADPVAWGAISFKHRMKVALLNLPLLCCLSYFLVRSLTYSGTFRHPAAITRALAMLWQDRAYIVKHRKVLQLRTLCEIGRLRGPLFF